MNMTLYFVLIKNPREPRRPQKKSKHVHSIDTCVQLSQTYSVHIDDHII